MITETEGGITLRELFSILMNRWWVILASVIAFFGLAMAYSIYRLDDYYTASSSMIVQVNEDIDSEYTNLLVGQRLAYTYSEIAISNTALSELVTRLDLDYSVSQLQSMISVHSVNDTQIVELRVESFNADDTALIANELVIIVQEISHLYEGLETVEILDSAQTPTSPTGPNRLLHAVIGVLLGGIVGCGLIFVYELFNDRIRSIDDIENKLDLKVLGIIPDYVKDEVSR